MIENYLVLIIILPQKVQHPIHKISERFDAFVNVKQMAKERLKLTFSTVRLGGPCVNVLYNLCHFFFRYGDLSRHCVRHDDQTNSSGTKGNQLLGTYGDT